MHLCHPVAITAVMSRHQQRGSRAWPAPEEPCTPSRTVLCPRSQLAIRRRTTVATPRTWVGLTTQTPAVLDLHRPTKVLFFDCPLVPVLPQLSAPTPTPQRLTHSRGEARCSVHHVRISPPPIRPTPRRLYALHRFRRCGGGSCLVCLEQRRSKTPCR